MNVFLTPQLEPFFGGSYFPPEDDMMRPGFTTLCRSIQSQVPQEKQPFMGTYGACLYREMLTVYV